MPARPSGGLTPALAPARPPGAPASAGAAFARQWRPFARPPQPFLLNLKPMQRTLVPVLAWLALGAAATAASAAQPLLTPTELQALQTQQAAPVVRVIDVRDAKSYAANHIAKAVNAPYAQWRGPASNPGDPPAPAQLTQLVQSLGLTAGTHAVVVSSGADTTDFGAAARVYWTLKMLGVKDLSILNGGMQAWAGAALPQTTEVWWSNLKRHNDRLSNLKRQLT